MAAAYRIVARVAHDTLEVGCDAVKSEIDETWFEQEVRLLRTALRVLVTPMTVSRKDALESIEALGIPVNDGTCTEARSHLLRGYAEAHARVEEALKLGLNIARSVPHELLTEDWPAGLRPAAGNAAPHSPNTDIRISMDGRGRWMDNVFIERLWCSLKYECVYLHAFETGSELRTGLTRWIAYYNQHRPHSALGGQTPDEAYGQIGRSDDGGHAPHHLITRMAP